MRGTCFLFVLLLLFLQVVFLGLGFFAVVLRLLVWFFGLFLFWRAFGLFGGFFSDCAYHQCRKKFAIFFFLLFQYLPVSEAMIFFPVGQLDFSWLGEERHERGTQLALVGLVEACGGSGKFLNLCGCSGPASQPCIHSLPSKVLKAFTEFTQWQMP